MFVAQLLFVGVDAVEVGIAMKSLAGWSQSKKIQNIPI